MTVRIIHKRAGLGDVVAVFAKPIGAASDAILGTDFANCRGCAERQERWNASHPNVNPFADKEFNSAPPSAFPSS